MGKAEKAEAAPEAEWAEPEEEEAPHLGACVERAKSGRSLCKECRLPIAQDALRIGADYLNSDGPAEGKVFLSWRHPRCFSLPENECLTIEDLRGFSELSSAQKKAVREAIEGGMASRGEGPVAAAEEEEEEEEVAVPPPRAPKAKAAKATKRKKEAAPADEEEEPKPEKKAPKKKATPKKTRSKSAKEAKAARATG